MTVTVAMNARHVTNEYLGNLARLIAFSLAKSPRPTSVTLHLHRATLLEEWRSADSSVTLVTNDVSESTSDISVETRDATDPIHLLITTTKNLTTVAAIAALKHRLSVDSTIVFTQNGLGIMDEVTAELFPDAALRPRYLACVTTHGVYSLAPFKSVHAGQGTIAIGSPSSASTAAEEPCIPSSQFLLERITSAPILAASAVSTSQLLFLQLQKLTINAMINPLSVLFRCRNGQLIDPEFPSYALVTELQTAMLREISSVLLALPEMASLTQEERRAFEIGPLGRKVYEINVVVQDNMSSMYQDAEAGRETEVKWINGWVVSKGKQLGIDCKVNKKVVELVGKGFPREDTNIATELAGVLGI